MVKHIKLFENWAEENAKLPEYLDPKKKTILHDGKRYKNITHPELIKKFTEDKDVLNLEYISFKSFSDYSFWRDYYGKIVVQHFNCKYKLEDLIGIPCTDRLKIQNAKVKTLNGLDNKQRSFTSLSIEICRLENLKYCPEAAEYNFTSNPLLSYYGIKNNNILDLTSNLCGLGCYEIAGYTKYSAISQKVIKDVEFHSNIFSYFLNEKNKINWSNGIQFNPWNQIYEDPSEVENYDFLFVPFYLNSEKFRDKVKEYLPNVDLSGVTFGRTDLW